MPLISLIVVLILVGVLMWAVNRFIPMEPNIKNILNIAVIVIIVLWLVSIIFGGFGAIDQIRVGPIR